MALYLGRGTVRKGSVRSSIIATLETSGEAVSG